MDALAQIAAGIFPPSCKAKIVAMLFGYFDESGTDGQHGFTVIAGLVGPIEEWSRLVRQWDERLDRDGIQTFHYVECAGRNGEYWGWDRETQCKPHLGALSDIIVNHGVAAVDAGFIGNYPKLCKSLPARFVDHYPTAYSLCFEMLLARIRMAAAQWREEPIVLIFAKQDQFQGLALKRWNVAKAGKLWPRIAHIGYAEPDLVHQLQAADMLAWETRRFMWEKTPASAIHEMPLLSKLLKKEKDMGNTLYEASMDEDIVREMAEETEAKMGT